MTISITRQQRVLVLLTSVALALVLLFVTAVSADAGGNSEISEPTTTTHLVVGGETLWDIALTVAESGSDVRNVVEDIKRLNSLTTSMIVPGQLLLLPGT
jgi:hypothetical protein